MCISDRDDALEGGEGAYAYDESMDSAIADRLNKLLRSSSMGKERAYQDRDRIKSLISDISHQIRTPLSNIMLYTGLLQEKKLDGQSRMLADQIQGCLLYTSTISPTTKSSIGISIFSWFLRVTVQVVVIMANNFSAAFPLLDS